jgi:hypothetical protein
MRSQAGYGIQELRVAIPGREGRRPLDVCSISFAKVMVVRSSRENLVWTLRELLDLEQNGALAPMP